jgi:hypothetical protein
MSRSAARRQPPGSWQSTTGITHRLRDAPRPQDALCELSVTTTLLDGRSCSLQGPMSTWRRSR